MRQRHPAAWLSGCTPRRCKETLAIDTLSGLKTVTTRVRAFWQVEMGAYSAMPGGLPAVNMGEGPLVGQELQVEENLWRVTCISVGNPHCVTSAGGGQPEAGADRPGL